MKNKKIAYQLFGSADSKDYDIMVFVEEIPSTIELCHDLCKELKAELSGIYTDKPVNCNLAVLENGNVKAVFKGWPDEVNNALFYTRHLHPQNESVYVTSVLERDVDQKLLRACRSILSFFTRSVLRPEVKKALRGDLHLKLEVLKKIDFCVMRDFNGAGEEEIKDVYKVIAFQLTQLFSLLDGHEEESYTKSGLMKHYPDVSVFLGRKEHTIVDLGKLNESKERLICFCGERIVKMKKLVE